MNDAQHNGAFMQAFNLHLKLNSVEGLMRIAYFTDTYMPEINGVTNTLAKLSGYLEQNGIRHVFFAPDYNGGDDISDFRVFPGMKKLHRFPGIRVSISPNSRLAFPKSSRIFDLCDKFAPDLVHVTTEFGIGYNYAFAWTYGELCAMLAMRQPPKTPGCAGVSPASC